MEDPIRHGELAPSSCGRTEGEEPLQIVSFRVGQEEFGLDILRVQEIIRHQQLTRVPNSPDYVDGVINLRGKVIPVIALRKRLGLDYASEGGQTRIVVLEVQNTVLGFVVDSVPEVLRIAASAVVAPPRVAKAEREYVSGVARLDDRLLMLLDVDQIMNSGEVRASAMATA